MPLLFVIKHRFGTMRQAYLCAYTSDTKRFYGSYLSLYPKRGIFTQKVIK